MGLVLTVCGAVSSLMAPTVGLLSDRTRTRLVCISYIYINIRSSMGSIPYFFYQRRDDLLSIIHPYNREEEGHGFLREYSSIAG